jgi:hypothetical protein
MHMHMFLGIDMIAHWVFWIGPILGASLAGILYEYCYHEGGYKVDALIDQYIVKDK